MGLLNRIGAFFYERATPAVTETVGVGGAVSSGGYLNSNEASGDMVGFNRWRKTAEWKRNVGIVSAALRRFLELAGSPKWSVAPFDKSAESMKRAEFANAQIRGLATPWRTVTLSQKEIHEKTFTDDRLRLAVDRRPSARRRR